jgi:hypothetical protein
LLIETIATKGELDEFEQQNIEEVMQWVFGRKFKAKDVFGYNGLNCATHFGLNCATFSAK